MKRASIGNLFLSALAALALCDVCNAETQYLFMREKRGNKTPLGSWSPIAPAYTDDRAVITDLTYSPDDPSGGDWSKVRARLRFLGSGGEGASDAHVLVRMVDYRDRQMFQVRSGSEWVYAVNHEIEPRYDVDYTVDFYVDYAERTYTVSVNGKPLSSCESGATTFALSGSAQCVSGVNFAGTTRFISPLEGYSSYRSWTGAGSGTDWASAENWLGGSVPTGTISPRFESGAMSGGATVSFSAAQSVNGDVIVNAGTTANPIVFTATAAVNGLSANALRIGTRCGGAFSLNGGTLTVQKVMHGGGPDAGTFTLNGGTLKAAAARTLIEGGEKLSVNVGANGGTIDNNGKQIVLAKAFEGNGKLILTGSGTTSLAGGNTLSGGIDVTGGCTLQVTPGKQVTSGGLAMAGGTTLAVPSGIAPTIGGALSVTGSGSVSVRIGGGESLGVGSYTILVSSGENSFAGVVGRLSVVNPIAAGATATLAALGGRGQRLVLVVSNPGDYVWTGAGDNNYMNNPYNWSDRIVPNHGGETVVFGGASNTFVRCNVANFAPSNVVFGVGAAKFTFGDGLTGGMHPFTNVVKIVNKSAESHVFNVPVHFKAGYFVDFATVAVNFAGGAYATTLDPETRDNAVSHRLTGVIHLKGDWIDPPALANPYTVPAGSQLYGVSMSGNRAQTVLCVDEGGYANFSGTVRTGNPCGRVSVRGEMDVGLWVVQGTGGYGHVAFDGDQSGSGVIRAGGVWKGDGNCNMNKNVYVKIPHLYVGADGLGAKIKDYSIHFDGGNQTVHATADFAIFGPRRAADLHDWGLSINTKTMFDTAGHTVTWTGGAQGAGAIVKTGAGTLYMNPYGSALSGAVTVSNGTVRIAKLDTNDPAFGSGAMTVASGATLAADFGAKTAALSLEAGATLDVAVCSEGEVAMAVTGSLTLPAAGKASLTRAGGAFGAGRYAILQNSDVTPSEAFAGFEPLLADGLECGFRKDGDILGLVVYPIGTVPVWTGLAGDGKMSSADNWGRGCAPRGGETARFNNTSAITVDADLGDITLCKLEMGSGVVTLTGNLRVSTLTNAYTLAVAQGATLTIEGDIVSYAANNTKPLLHSNYGTVTVGGQVHFRNCSDKNRALSTVVQYAVADENTNPIIANGLAHNACTKPDNNWYPDWLVANLGSMNGGVGKWVIGPGGMTFPAHRDISLAGFHAINGQTVVLCSSANWTLAATRQNKTNPAGDLQVHDTSCVTIDTSDYFDQTIPRTITFNGRICDYSTHPTPVVVKGCGKLVINSSKVGTINNTLVVTNSATLEMRNGKTIGGSGAVAICSDATLYAANSAGGSVTLPGLQLAAGATIVVANGATFAPAIQVGSLSAAGTVRVRIGTDETIPVCGSIKILASTAAFGPDVTAGQFVLANPTGAGAQAQFSIQGSELWLDAGDSSPEICVWTGAGANKYMSNAANWRGGNVPSNGGETVVFTAGSATTVICDLANFAPSNVVFAAKSAKFTFGDGSSGSQPFMNVARFVNNSSVEHVVNVPVSFAGDIDVSGSPIRFAGGATGVKPVNHAVFNGNYNLTATSPWTPGANTVVTNGTLSVANVLNASGLSVAAGGALVISGDLVGYAANNTKPLLHSNYGTVTVGGAVRFHSNGMSKGESIVSQYAVTAADTKPIIANGLAYDACKKPDDNWYPDWLVANLGSMNSGVGKWVIGGGGMAIPQSRIIWQSGFRVANGQAVTLGSAANWTLAESKRHKGNDLYIVGSGSVTLDTTDYNDHVTPRTVTFRGYINAQGTGCEEPLTVCGNGTLALTSVPANGCTNKLCKALAVTDTATLKVTNGVAIVGSGKVSVGSSATLYAANSVGGSVTLPELDLAAGATIAVLNGGETAPAIRVRSLTTEGTVYVRIGSDEKRPVCGRVRILASTEAFDQEMTTERFSLVNPTATGEQAQFTIEGNELWLETEDCCLWTGAGANKSMSNAANWLGGNVPSGGGEKVAFFANSPTTVICDLENFSPLEVFFVSCSAEFTFNGATGLQPSISVTSIVNGSSLEHVFNVPVNFANDIDVYGSPVRFNGGATGVKPVNHKAFHGNYNLTTATWTPDEGSVVASGTLSVANVKNASGLSVAAGATLAISGNLVGYAANSTKPLLHSNYGTVTVGGKVYFRDNSNRNRAISRVAQYAVFDENTKPIIANGLAHDACKNPDNPNDWYKDYLVADLGSMNGGAGKWVIGPGGMTFPAHRDIAWAGFHATNGQAVVLYSSANWTLEATRANKTNPAGDLQVHDTSCVTIDTSDYFDQTIPRTVTFNGRICDYSRHPTPVVVKGCGKLVINSSKVGTIKNALVVTDSATLEIKNGKSIGGSGTVSIGCGAKLNVANSAGGFITLPGLEMIAGSTVTVANVSASVPAIKATSFRTLVGASGAKVSVRIGSGTVGAGTYTVLSAPSISANTGDFVLANVASGCTATFSTDGNALVVTVAGETPRGMALASPNSAILAEGLARARLLNLDPAKADAAGEVTIKGIRVVGKKVEVDVALARRGALQKDGGDAPINGVVRLYAVDIATGRRTLVDGAVADDPTFAKGDTTTFAFETEVPAGFYRAAIEEAIPPAP